MHQYVLLQQLHIALFCLILKNFVLVANRNRIKRTVSLDQSIVMVAIVIRVYLVRRSVMVVLYGG